MFTGKPCSRLQCVSICVLRVQEISSEYPVACGWQLHAWLAAPRLAGSSTLGWQLHAWLAAPRVVGSSTCGWQLHVWLAAPRLAGSSTCGWQLHVWLAAPCVILLLLKQPAVYFSLCCLCSWTTDSASEGRKAIRHQSGLGPQLCTPVCTHLID